MADLTPYARNSRQHSQAQIAQIAASIKEWGWTQPIIIDDEGGILAGHGRLLAAQHLGLEEVPCVVATGWSEAKRRAYVIADNRLAETATWDQAMLATELQDLAALDFDLELTGWDGEELARLLDGGDDAEDGDGQGADTAPEIDRAEELRQKWGVETGQLWQLGEHRLLCGDSTKAADVTRVLGDDCPHLMVTDPPYGVEYEPAWRIEVGKTTPSMRRPKNDKGATGKVNSDDRADWREAWALFPGEVAYVWHAMKTQFAVAESLLALDFEIRAEIVWAKSNLVISQGHYHPQHESCFYAVRHGGTGHWQGDRTQTTLWDIDKPKKSETGHSTQKPLECMARPIRNNSAPGDCIYEPFSGSGTTLIACENLNRRCRAIEISPAYVAVALERWHQHTGQTPVLLP